MKHGCHGPGYQKLSLHQVNEDAIEQVLGLHHIPGNSFNNNIKNNHVRDTYKGRKYSRCNKVYVFVDACS